jgi:hypothetical protein
MGFVKKRCVFYFVRIFIVLFPRASAAASGGVWGSAPSVRSVTGFGGAAFQNLVDLISERLLFFGWEGVWFFFHSAFCYPREL